MNLININFFRITFITSSEGINKPLTKGPAQNLILRTAGPAQKPTLSASVSTGRGSVEVGITAEWITYLLTHPARSKLHVYVHWSLFSDMWMIFIAFRPF